MSGFRSIAKDCAGRFQGREEWGETRELAAAHLFDRWPDEPACSTIPADGPTRDRCLPDGTLTPAGDDGTEYHTNPVHRLPPYRGTREELSRALWDQLYGTMTKAMPGDLPPDRNVYGE